MNAFLGVFCVVSFASFAVKSFDREGRKEKRDTGLRSVKVKARMALLVGISGLLLVSAALAGPGKEKEPEGQPVDSGSFGVFMNGHRVATEKFSIQQD